MSGAAGSLAKNVAGGVGGGLVGDLAGAVGGDMVGDLAAAHAGRAIGNAAGKATSKAVDKKLNKPAPGAPAAADDAAGMPAMPAAPDASADVGLASGAAMGAMPPMPSAPPAEAEAPMVEAPTDDYDRPVTGADWNGWDQIDPEEFFYRIKVLEHTGIHGGDDAYEAKMREMGFRDHIHYQRVKDAYTAGKDPDLLAQSALNATGRHSKEQMKAAAPSFPDVHGLDVRTYGVVASRRARCKDDAARAALLAEYGLDDAKYGEVDATWQARMQETMTRDPMAGGDLMSKYGQGFAEGSTGQFAKAAQAGGVASDVNTAAGTAPDAPEPVPFAKFVEIEQAQRAWSQQGLDIGAKLQEVFGISILDWSDIGAYWSPKITSDLNYARQYNELQPRFAAQYGAISAA